MQKLWKKEDAVQNETGARKGFAHRSSSGGKAFAFCQKSGKR